MSWCRLNTLSSLQVLPPSLQVQCTEGDYAARGLAWMVMSLMKASTPLSGRWFLALTGIRSSSSSVSHPSITFPNTVYLEGEEKSKDSYLLQGRW